MRILSLIMVIGLTGCSPYQSGFDCPAGKGRACTSLYRINKLIDRGEVGQIEKEEPLNAGLPQAVDPHGGLEVFLPAHQDESGTWYGARTVIIPKVYSPC